MSVAILVQVTSAPKWLEPVPDSLESGHLILWESGLLFLAAMVLAFYREWYW